MRRLAIVAASLVGAGAGCTAGYVLGVLTAEWDLEHIGGEMAWDMIVGTAAGAAAGAYLGAKVVA